MAACSYHHSVLLCSDGSLFSCGRNDCGQLGHGDFIDKKTPHIVPPLLSEESPKEPSSEPSFKEHSSKEASGSERRIIGLSCGQFHTVLLDINGLTYSCGKNDYGQLCMEGPENMKNFTQTIGSADKGKVKQVCCGYYHTLFLSQSGIVTAFGRNDYGQLGLGHSQARVFGGHTVAYLR
jgi:RCC1 and BTB domain-containing protein